MKNSTSMSLFFIRRFTMKPAIPLTFCVLLLLVVLAFTQSTTSPVFPSPGKTSMSKENQNALGMEAAAQVYKTMPVLSDDSPESQYIRQLGQKLVDTIPRENSWPFAFHVI